MKIAYKLFTKRKDGTLGPLFINKRQRVAKGVWLDAESHPTKGFAYRPGWHTMHDQSAPHLNAKDNRVWCKVGIKGYKRFTRPDTQGGLWFLAKQMMVLEELT